MRSVGLKIVKNKLSEYVRLAAAGETVVITDRGRTVAEIGPPRGKPVARRLPRPNDSSISSRLHHSEESFP